MSSSDFTGNGGHGGLGGSGYGAIVDSNGLCFLTNCTIAFNQSSQGTGGMGGPAGPWIYPPSYPPRLGAPGGNGADGDPGAGLKTIGAHLLNTVLSSNAPANCVGVVADDGYNLSSDATPAFSGAGSMSNTDPKLRPLADNGGPTLTMALVPGSPAINAGASIGAPTTDQRGVARPKGGGVDIGAFEFEFEIPQIARFRLQSPRQFWLQSCGLPDHTYTLQSSTNLTYWSDLTNLCVGADGFCTFVDSSSNGCERCFYRLKPTQP